MTASASAANPLLTQALQARQQGRTADAGRLFESVLASDPDNAAALNSLGLMALAANDPGRGVAMLSRATAADPGAAPLWLNLAEAHRAAGDPVAEIAALDGALAIDPYLLPALLRKAQAWERHGDLAQSARVYRALLAACPDERGLPDQLKGALAHGRKIVLAQGEARAQAIAAPLQEVYDSHPDADFTRVRTYGEFLAGRRRIYHHQPTGGHFPFLPAIEYFGRAQFPWFDALERQTTAIRDELVALWTGEDQGFRPYVAFDKTTPANQWAELNHSPRWSAWFLWKDGVRQDDHCARCPATARAVEATPLLDIPGKSPSVMFSILEPGTRIPPHTGSTNVRATVHLPLVVPPSCGFRVGAETREWREGQAWAFDDTIEHEAWNGSDRPRAILILDVWNPLLTEAERAAIRVVG